MPVGIAKLAAYVPPWRLTPDHFRAAWGSRVKTTRSVAGHDEDALTMAVDAALAAVGDEAAKIGGVYFAASKSPFGERAAAPLLAAAVDVGAGAFSGEFVGSPRAATQALRAAADAVRAGSAERVLVAAGDVRLAPPGDAAEATLGDAGAAVVVGKDNLLAEIVGARSHLEEFPDVWAADDEPFLQQGDAKFIGDYGLPRILKAAIEGLLADANVARDKIAALALYAPDARALAGLSKALGFAPEKIAGEAALDKIGNAGAAAPLLALCDALSRAKPGDLLVLAGYGGGADAMLLSVRDGIEARRGEFDLAPFLKGGTPLASYEKYLLYRRILPVERLNPFTSLPVLWREQRALLRLYGARCKACGAIQYPPQRICRECSSKDAFDAVRLKRKGVVYTFTRDHLVPGPDGAVAMISADLEGGGRFYGQLTDADPAVAKVGLPVELVFRRMHEAEGLVHYFWKFRPREI